MAQLETLAVTNVAAEASRLDRYDANQDALARWIDPAAASIADVSRVETVHSQCP